MNDNNPFGGPFSGFGPVGGNPLDSESNLTPKCPKCRSSNFHAYTNQYGITRQCKDCKEEWSGGVGVSANAALSDSFPQGAAPLDDIPVVQYTGAAFRDPSKSYDGDDDW